MATTETTDSNNRAGVDAGRGGLFTMGRARSGTTQRERWR